MNNIVSKLRIGLKIAFFSNGIFNYLYILSELFCFHEWIKHSIVKTKTTVINFSFQIIISHI